MSVTPRGMPRGTPGGTARFLAMVRAALAIGTWQRVASTEQLCIEGAACEDGGNGRSLESMRAFCCALADHKVMAARVSYL